MSRHDGKQVRLADLQLAQIADRVAAQLNNAPPRSATRRLIERVMDQLSVAEHRDVSHPEAVRLVSRAFVHARLVWGCADPALHRAAAATDFLPPPSSLLGSVLRPSLGWTSANRRLADDEAALETTLRQIDALQAAGPRSRESFTHPYDLDRWLAVHDRATRTRWGVYFTPRELADYVVARVDHVLRLQCGLTDGLADTTTWAEGVERFPILAGQAIGTGRQPMVQILDPALGTGIFPAAATDRIFQTLQKRWTDLRYDGHEREAAWNDYVTHHLLPRLVGIEKMLPTAAVAWLRFAERLAASGYRWREPAALQFLVADSLAGPPPPSVDGVFPARGSVPFSRAPCSPAPSVPGPLSVPGRPFTVVIGNPPFAALTDNRQPWIGQLLKDRHWRGQEVGSYYEVDGQPLGEKKLWLHDDYVKFLRLAQWQIETSGCGVVGYVTNHGYLDNLTFRGVRQSLARTFSSISVLDLHGNQKKRESAPDGQRDENVFDISPGVAVGIFCKPPSAQVPCVTYAEVWGDRAHKLAALRGISAEHKGEPVVPRAPHYLLLPSSASSSLEAEYERGLPLTQAMPVYSSAAVTARDALVVAFTAEELLERFETFRNPAIPDDVIRQDLLPRTRSRRYLPGDTRGWKLGPARDLARNETNPSSLLRSCQYRPFDHRVILWTDWLVDWPRSKVMRHMDAGDNIALVTRRQMLPGHPCNFFFVTSTVVIDGLLRSDNRGNESFFPLYLCPDARDPSARRRPVNLLPALIAAGRQLWSLKWTGAGHSNLVDSFGACDLFAMVYAQFCSEDYRERYQHALRIDFPRLFLPRSRELFVALCRLGYQLLKTQLPREHAGRDAPVRPAPARIAPVTGLPPSGLFVRSPFPYVNEQGLHLAHDVVLSGAWEREWNYRVGGHQVCRKWLRDRQGRRLSPQDLQAYLHIVAAVQRTMALSREIDAVIRAAGGWPGAFAGREAMS